MSDTGYGHGHLNEASAYGATRKFDFFFEAAQKQVFD